MKKRQLNQKKSELEELTLWEQWLILLPGDEKRGRKLKGKEFSTRKRNNEKASYSPSRP